MTRIGSGRGSCVDCSINFSAWKNSFRKNRLQRVANLHLGRLRHPVLVAVHRHPLDFDLVRLDFGNIVVAQLCGGVVQVGHFVESVPLGLSEPEPVHSGGNALLLGRHQSRRRACSRRYVGGERFGVAVPVPVPVYDVSVGKTPSCIRIGRYRRCSRRTTLEAERRRDAFRVERLLSGQVLVVVARTLQNKTNPFN